MLKLSPQQLVMNLVVVVIALMVHEIAHAATALAFGDSSQKDRGRISLNPLKHLDPFGFIMLVILGFGWAKPVIFDPAAMKHRNLGAVAVPLAGPLANLLLALLGFGLIKLIGVDTVATNQLVLDLMVTFIAINLGLFLFNLLPFPPLDGSHLVTEAFFRDKPLLVLRFNQIGSLVLLGIFLLQAITDTELIPFSTWIRRLFELGFQIFGLA